MKLKQKFTGHEFVNAVRTQVNLPGARIIASSESGTMSGFIQSVYLNEVAMAYSSAERTGHTKINLELKGGARMVIRSTDADALFIVQFEDEV